MPKPSLVQNATDPSVCGRVHALEDLLVSDKNRGVKNAIVALKDEDGLVSGAGLPKHLVLDNRSCRFEPHVSVLTVGSTIQALNSDSALHTVHYYGALRDNIALPFEGSQTTTVVDEPGMIVVKCDVHGWMQAYIRVDSHPLHAVTDTHGYFRIDDVASGAYELEVWHERLGRISRTIEVDPQRTERLEIRYSNP